MRRLTTFVTAEAISCGRKRDDFGALRRRRRGGRRFLRDVGRLLLGVRFLRRHRCLRALRLRLGGLLLARCRRFGLHIELELEIDRRIVKAAHGGEGDLQPLRHVGEGEADLEAGVADLQVPVLELDHDGHLLGIFFAQARRDAHARRSRQEGDEEVMVAGQASPRHLGQDLAHDAAQRLLGKNVVADVVFGHSVGGPVNHL
jgi:hypothetical protein